MGEFFNSFSHDLINGFFFFFSFFSNGRARMKRQRTSRGDQLTGGSGDVNPQILRASLHQGLTDAVARSAISLPVQRLPSRSGKSLVMEITKVMWDFTLTPDIVDTTATRNYALAQSMILVFPL